MQGGVAEEQAEDEDRAEAPLPAAIFRQKRWSWTEDPPEKAGDAEGHERGDDRAVLLDQELHLPLEHHPVIALLLDPLGRVAVDQLGDELEHHVEERIEHHEGDHRGDAREHQPEPLPAVAPPFGEHRGGDRDRPRDPRVLGRDAEPDPDAHQQEAAEGGAEGGGEGPVEGQRHQEDDEDVRLELRRAQHVAAERRQDGRREQPHPG